MPTFNLNGVAFALPDVPGYQPAIRVIVNATLDVDAAFIAAVDAGVGATYTGTGTITATTKHLDTGASLGTGGGGSVSVFIGALQSTLGPGQGRRTIGVAVPDYAGGSYTGTAWCTAFEQVGALIEPEEPPAPTPTFASGGLLARYYANQSMVGEPVLTRIENPYYAYGRDGDSPSPGIVPPDFSDRWTGSIKIPETGDYRFSLNHDDGGRLYINGRIAIDAWDRPGRDFTGTYRFTLDEFVNIWIEHYDYVAEATLQLDWVTPSSSGMFGQLPNGVLYPTAGNETPPREAARPIQGHHSVDLINRY